MVSALLNWMYYIKYTKVQVEYKKKKFIMNGKTVLSCKCKENSSNLAAYNF